LGGDGSFERTREQRIVHSISRGGKEFSVYTLNEEFIGKWINASLCAEDLNLNSRTIRKCLNRKMFTYKNYIFVYHDKKEKTNLQEILNKINSPIVSSKQFNVYSLKTYKHIGQFTNQTECARQLDILPCSISGCIWILS